jgi:hypothetical protein
MTHGISRSRIIALCLAPAAIVWLVLTSLWVPRPAGADDLKLKDGTIISGTIVGFEEKSFKVKTSYGFAVVQKDQVASISMSDAPKPTPEKKPEAAESKPSPSEKPKAEPAHAALPPEPATLPNNTTNRSSSAPTSTPPVAGKTIAPRATAPAIPAVATPAKAPEQVAAAKPVAPEPIREEVTGNTYTNDTYRFKMYKPPDWEVIVAERALLPGAIAAMGTNDQATYLLIGQEPAGKSVAAETDATDRRLRDIMENFRPLDQKQISISGIAATEHHFRGTADDHEWSGVVVLLPRGTRLYTIFGMTRADTDLVQIQENVIARAISSFQFTDQ